MGEKNRVPPKKNSGKFRGGSPKIFGNFSQGRFGPARVAKGSPRVATWAQHGRDSAEKCAPSVALKKKVRFPAEISLFFGGPEFSITQIA